MARANSLGGVIHSDEFQRLGILGEEEALLRKATAAREDDAVILLAGPADRVEACAPRVVERLKEAARGVPAETRAATDGGETRYMRPRPGSQRMYPETDIPNIGLTKERLSGLAASVPQNWEARVSSLAKAYSLSEDMSLKLYDSELDGEFEALSRELKLEPSVIASALVDLPVRLAREGVPESALGLELLREVLRAVSKGKVAKEAIPDVLKAVGAGGGTVEDAIGSLGLRRVEVQEIQAVVQAVVSKHIALVNEKGEGAFAPLMGEAMKELRGRADGAEVARVLKAELERVNVRR